MIIKLLLAVALLFGLFWYLNQLQNMPTKARKKAIYKAILIVLGGILLLGTITGRMHWFGAALAALIPLLKIGFTTFTRFAPLWMNHTGGLANFKTEHLDAKVQLQSGTVSGMVIKGPLEGRDLDSLEKEELDKLETYYKDKDTKSYYLIRLKQKKTQNQQNHDSQAPSFAAPHREEALQILGLSGNPTKEDINTAHRKLINKVHPDKGGNDFLASRINQARDVLLGK